MITFINLLNSNEYIFDINLKKNVYNTYSEFCIFFHNRFIELNIIDNNKIIKYMYNNIIISNKTYYLVKKDNVTIHIIFEKSIEVCVNDKACAILIGGNIITVGDPNYGGDTSLIKKKLIYIKNIYSTNNTFCALDENNSIITWNTPTNNTIFTLDCDINEIYSNYKYFTIIDNINNNIIIWNIEYKAIISIKPNTIVNKIYSLNNIFVTLTSENNLIMWTINEEVGFLEIIQDKVENIKEIYSIQNSFSVLTYDGNVIMWTYSEGNFLVIKNELKNIKKIYSIKNVGVALTNDGNVITWIISEKNIIFSEINHIIKEKEILFINNNYDVFDERDTLGEWILDGNEWIIKKYLRNIKEIYCTKGAFAALTNDGTVITWGYTMYGADSSEVQFELLCKKNIKEIYCVERAFAALTYDNTVIVWGYIMDSYHSINKIRQQTHKNIYKIICFDEWFKFIRNNDDYSIKIANDIKSIHELYIHSDIVLNNDGCIEARMTGDWYDNEKPYIDFDNIKYLINDYWSDNYIDYDNDNDLKDDELEKIFIFDIVKETQYVTNIKEIYSNYDIGYIAITYDNNIIFMNTKYYDKEINEIILNYNK